MWNLGVVNDWAGATALANDLSQQARWGLSSSIVWCLIFSWYAPLPFSRPTGTNAGGGHALLTAAEPWSGNYVVTPTVHVIAHHTQFAEPGWHYLAGAGMGALAGGGSYVTRVNTHVPSAVLEFSITIDVMGVGSAQTAAFTLAGLSPGRALPTALHVWTTTQALPFTQQADIAVAADGSFSLLLPADAMVSLTTTTGQSAPRPSVPVPPSAPFPFPYAESFEGYALQGYAKYFCDEGGLFIVDSIPPSMLADVNPSVAAGSAYHNVIDVIPIVWETNPKPYSERSAIAHRALHTAHAS
jgi:galactosylceramidase